MPRPPVKKTFKLSKAKKLGELSAQIDHENKTFSNKKMLWVSLKNHLGKMIDRVDPLEIIAVLGATYIIKNGIEWQEHIASGKIDFIIGLGTFLPRLLGIIPKELEIPETQALIEKALDAPEIEIIEWVISFIVAFLIVRHAGSIIQAGGNILGVAKGLIGALG